MVTRTIKNIATLATLVGALWIEGCEPQKQPVQRQVTQPVQQQPVEPVELHKEEVLTRKENNLYLGENRIYITNFTYGLPSGNTSETTNFCGIEIDKNSLFGIDVYNPAKDKLFTAVLRTSTPENPQGSQWLNGITIIESLLSVEPLKHEANIIADMNNDGLVDIAAYSFDSRTKTSLAPRRIYLRGLDNEEFFHGLDDVLSFFKQYSEGRHERLLR